VPTAHAGRGRCKMLRALQAFGVTCEAAVEKITRLTAEAALTQAALRTHTAHALTNTVMPMSYVAHAR
jgi:hypothetical protein